MKTLPKEIDILELFSGIGGFTHGFEKAGYNIRKHYFSEIEPNAIANYKYNFPNAQYAGPVQSISVKNIPTAHVVSFGSPCQDFSIYGKRAGLEGSKSSLITEAIRIVSEIRPSVFIWENVKGTFSSNNGEDFWAIIQAFANIGGYRLEWQLLNTNWVLPQNRERIYLIGHLAGSSSKEIFPITENGRLFNEKGIKQSQTKNASTIGIKTLRKSDSFVNVPKIAKTITAGGNSGGLHSQMNTVMQLNNSDESNGTQPYQQNRVYSDQGISPALNGACGRHTVDISPKVLVGKFSRTDDAKQARKKAMKKGKDHTPFSDKKLDFVDQEFSNTLTISVGKYNLIMVDEGISTFKSCDYRADKEIRVNESNEAKTLLARKRNDFSCGQFLMEIPANNKKGKSVLKEGDGLDMTQLSSKTRRGRVKKGQSSTLTCANNQGTLQSGRLRKFTEIECERLQGFPDNWTKYGMFENNQVKQISSTQRYAMLGNAVTVDIVQLIASTF